MKYLNSHAALGALALLLAFVVGCAPDEPSTAEPNRDASHSGDLPVFTLAWSEYPSRSVFGAAAEIGWIDGRRGRVGEIETEYGVDIVLEAISYATSVERLRIGRCDAACVNNVDALLIAPTRPLVAILPTSTSDGADACVVVGIDTVQELKPVSIFGLGRSTAEYCFLRCIETLESRAPAGLSPEQFRFVDQDPGAAALAIQNQASTHRAVMAWNPFLLQTLKDRETAEILFDSSLIPGELVDLVVVGRDCIERPEGSQFAQALIETFYRMQERIADVQTRADTLVALAAPFSDLDHDEMERALRQTRFYRSADAALELLESREFANKMQTVREACIRFGFIETTSFSFGPQSPAPLLFEARYLSEWRKRSGGP